MKPDDTLVRVALGVIFASVALIFSSCTKSSTARHIEIWVSPNDKPQIRVDAQGEYWSHGSGIHDFRATIGPKLLKNDTVLEGELTWSKDNSGQASFSFTLSNEKAVTVVLLGVAKNDSPLPEKDARLSVSFPPGKHSFNQLLFVKYTYD